MWCLDDIIYLKAVGHELVLLSGTKGWKVIQMGRNRRTDGEFKKTVGAIKENSQSIAENIVHTNEKLDNIKSDIDAIKKSSTSKTPVVIAIITLLVTFSGVSIFGIIDRMNFKTEPNTENFIDESGQESEYKIYLYSEYSTFGINTEVDMIASLNFEADAVSITAYLASGRKDTVSLERKNATEWKKKVEFTETGVHEIVVTATAPNGEVIENNIEVEVTSFSMDMDIFKQFLSP